MSMLKEHPSTTSGDNVIDVEVTSITSTTPGAPLAHASRIGTPPHTPWDHTTLARALDDINPHAPITSTQPTHTHPTAPQNWTLTRLEKELRIAQGPHAGALDAEFSDPSAPPSPEPTPTPPPRPQHPYLDLTKQSEPEIATPPVEPPQPQKPTPINHNYTVQQIISFIESKIAHRVLTPAETKAVQALIDEQIEAFNAKAIAEEDPNKQRALFTEIMALHTFRHNLDQPKPPLDRPNSEYDPYTIPEELTR